MELVKVIVALIPLILKPLKEVTKHVVYPFNVNNNISSLESVTTELKALKEDVKIEIINAARRNGKPTDQMKLWLDQVEAIEQKTEEISENYQQLRRCIWDISPYLWLNYKVSRNAAKKYAEAKSLRDKKDKIPVIVHMPPPLAQEMPVSSAIAPDLKLALSNIKNDAYNIIGIWGMGGVGKTHLLKQINNELSRDGTYVVVFVTCSKECSDEKVQKEIIKKLGLIQSDDVESRQSTIFNFLKQKRFVLLLDDLWGQVDLYKIGIPNTTKKKVVLTTRSENVCRLMDANKKMRVNVLGWDAAWNLFKGKANGNNIESNTLVRQYAVEVVKELGGLPLALMTIGRAMSDTTDPRDWKHAIQLLKQARLHEVEHSETDETVFKLLKFSYDKLRNDNLRECFLHCSLWPEDYEIKKNALVELWMGLGLIDEDDIHMAYNVAYSYIRELQAVCLLEATNKDNLVKLHDVIRDMSLWIISKQGIEKNKWIVISDAAVNESKDIVIQEKTEKISVTNMWGNFSFTNNNCDAKIITTLLMNCHNSRYFYRDGLNELKNQSFSKLTFLNLKNNGLKCVPIVICNIFTLQFVDLSKNGIMSLPNELEALNNLQYLLLRGNRILTVPVGTISKLRALKVLDLTPGYGWTRLDSELAFVPLLLIELQSLPAFSALGIEIDNVVHFHEPSALSNVPLRWLSISIRKKLSTFSFSPCFHATSRSRSNIDSLSITEMELERLIFECPCKYPSSCQLESLEKLHISCVVVKEILWKGLEPKTVLSMLKCLIMLECDGLTSISWIVHLPCLQELNIRDCSSLKQLVIESEVSEATFPSLKLLELQWLHELESICDPEIAFPSLESLKICYCDKLKKLPFRTANISPKLHSIMTVPEEWWDNIEWEDSSIKSSLYGFVKFTLF